MVEVALRPRSATGRFLEWHRGLDWTILMSAILLLCTGLLMSLAAGPPAAERLGYVDSFYFVKRHGMFVGAAVIVMISMSLLERVWARRIAALVFFGSLLLMAYILIPGQDGVKGAQRWIRFGGFGLQPSGFVKPALIVLTGWLLAQRALYARGPWAAITLVFFCVTLGLLLLQPDVGQSALLTAAFIVTFFVSGLPWRWAAVFAGGGAALSGLLYATLPHVRFRINSFINPSEYDTYQITRHQKRLGAAACSASDPARARSKPLCLTRIPISSML